MAIINLNNSDTDESVELSPGDIIHITLSENPTTGYMWESTEHDASQLELTSDSFKTGSAGTGSGGSRIFKFKALASGKGNIRLENRQKWENDIAETFTLKYYVSEKN